MTTVPVRAKTAATSLRTRLATLLTMLLIGPLLVATIVAGVVAPRTARSAAERSTSHDAASVVIALAARCEALGEAAKVTAGEVQAYATKYGSVTTTSAQAAVRRATAHQSATTQLAAAHPAGPANVHDHGGVGSLSSRDHALLVGGLGSAVAVFDASSRLLASGGAPAGLGPARAGGYGASCSRQRAGSNHVIAGLAERVPVNAAIAGRVVPVGYVVFWVPLDDAALRGLRADLGVASRLSLLAASAHGTASVDGTAPAHEGVLAESGPPLDDAEHTVSTIRPGPPGLPFQVLATASAPGAGLLHALAWAALVLALIAWLPSRMISARLSEPMVQALQNSAGQLQVSRVTLAGTFDRFGEALQHTLDLERLLDAIASACLLGTGAVAGIVLLVEETADGPDRVRSLQVRGTACAESPAARTAVAELPRFADRYFTGLPPGVPLPWFAQLSEGGPAVATPIVADGQVIGVLALARGARARAFEAVALPRVSALAEHAGAAIQNVRLHEEARRLSVTDPLTGVGNVRQLTSTLSREVERAIRFGRPLTVLMLDLDHFKQVNDTFGHAFGDLVLRDFAHRLLACVREVDMVSRYGGEEFAVVLPETDVEGGGRVAERVVNAVRSEPFRRGEQNCPVTVSVGVASFPRNGRSAAEVLQAADGALYAAKNAGRDRWETAVVTPGAAAVSQAG